MDSFDIAPFAFPNCDPGETRFEEPRDIESVVVRFRKIPEKPKRSPGKATSR